MSQTLTLSTGVYVVGSKSWSDEQKAAFIAANPTVTVKVNGKTIPYVKVKDFGPGKSVGFWVNGRVDVKLDADADLADAA